VGAVDELLIGVGQVLGLGRELPAQVVDPWSRITVSTSGWLSG
jgi:hypothetical protein